MTFAILGKSSDTTSHTPKALTMLMIAVLILGVFSIAYAPTAEAKSSKVTVTGIMTGTVVDLGRHTIDLKGEGGSVLLPPVVQVAKIKLETEAVVDSATITVTPTYPTDPNTGVTPASAVGLTGEGELEIKGKDADGNKIELEASWTVTSAAGGMLLTNTKTFLPAVLIGGGSAEVEVGELETS